MIELVVIAILMVVYILYINKGHKFQEIEREQAMRRAMLKLHEKNQRFSH
jgi:hypothetical protein